jgi:hypothetical protein
LCRALGLYGSPATSRPQGRPTVPELAGEGDGRPPAGARAAFSPRPAPASSQPCPKLRLQSAAEADVVDLAQVLRVLAVPPGTPTPSTWRRAARAWALSWRTGGAHEREEPAQAAARRPPRDRQDHGHAAARRPAPRCPDPVGARYSDVGLELPVRDASSRRRRSARGAATDLFTGLPGGAPAVSLGGSPERSPGHLWTRGQVRSPSRVSCWSSQP